MKVRWKIALLALLGFSTAACCTTKKAAKDSDSEGQNIEAEGIDTRIILMYGVPTPDGRFPAPESTPEIVRPVTPLPDGRVAVEQNIFHIDHCAGTGTDACACTAAVKSGRSRSDL